MVAPSVSLLHGHRHHLLASLYCRIREDTPMHIKSILTLDKTIVTLGKKILPVLPGISADDAAATYLTYGGISLQRPEDLDKLSEHKSQKRVSHLSESSHMIERPFHIARQRETTREKASF